MKFIETIKQYLFKPDDFEKINTSYQQGVRDERHRNWQQKRKFDDRLIKSAVGSRVICISGAWENPVVGVIIDYQKITRERITVPVVRDFLTGQEIIVLGKIMMYTPDRLRYIVNLNPRVRWDLMTINRPIELNLFYETSTGNEPELLSYEEIVERLKNANFFPLSADRGN